LALRRTEQLDRSDQRRKRGVLDHVHEQADERRQQSPRRLREDDVRVPADPPEAERRGRFVLLARDRLDRSARRLGDLGAPPQRQADRRRDPLGEAKVQRQSRQREEDDEERDDEREASPNLDVEPDESPYGKE